jgi:DNA-directed RNA polymerase specialized sigma24 family protein
MAESEKPSAGEATQPEQAQARSDQSLLRWLQLGDDKAATELHRRYAQRLLALAKVKCSTTLARCVEPEDIVQSVFRTFFRRAQSGEFDVPHGEELWGLLLVITLNKIRAQADFHFAAKRDARMSRALESVHTPESGDAPDEEALLQLMLDEAIASLPDSRRQMIRLRMAGHEVAEIAKLTQRPLRTVERVLQTFRESLRALLE